MNAQAPWLPLAFAGFCCMAGCGSTRQQASAIGRETVVQPTTRSGRWESFRLAEGKDLRATLIPRTDPTDHFPLSTLQVYNIADEDVIVGYEPGCVVVHCGDYEQRGPAVTFIDRREILRSQQPIEFELPSGGWARSPSSGARELLIPSELPAGRYPIWATFRVGGPNGDLIETARDMYIVP